MASDPDLVCLTEAMPDMLPPGGHALQPTDPPPYPRKDDGQKVLLWSKWPWLDSTGVLPGGTTGRFVEGITGPLGGPIRVVGVCIPWHDSHVRTGNADRSRWEDHLAYIGALGRRRHVRTEDLPEILIGDYNQRLPRHGQPVHVHDALCAVLSAHEVITSGWDDPKKAFIDHIALRGNLAGRTTRIWPKEMNGLKLSDHVGIAAEIEPPPS